ncbi:MAG: hypothetical protein WCW44_01345 [archaeon]|jgi:hypothetical protein
MTRFLNQRAQVLFCQKGQAAAPFELFVAVIIMTFVVIVGYNMLEKVNTEVCLNTVDREMTKFKIALEDTVARKSSNAFYFHPDEKCFASRETVMKLEVETNKNLCTARCNYPSEECYVMTFSNPNIPNAFKSKCIDLPPLTNFLTETSCEGGPDTADYKTVDPTKEGQILIGGYRLVNVSPAGDTYPKVCIWYKAA